MHAQYKTSTVAFPNIVRLLFNRPKLSNQNAVFVFSEDLIINIKICKNLMYMTMSNVCFRIRICVNAWLRNMSFVYWGDWSDWFNHVLMESARGNKDDIEICLF
jgi:hypothetical protein